MYVCVSVCARARATLSGHLRVLVTMISLDEAVGTIVKTFPRAGPRNFVARGGDLNRPLARVRALVDDARRDTRRTGSRLRKEDASRERSLFRSRRKCLREATQSRAPAIRKE